MKGKIIILITGLMVLFIIGVLFVPKDKVAVVVTNSTTELLMILKGTLLNKTHFLYKNRIRKNNP